MLFAPLPTPLSHPPQQMSNKKPRKSKKFQKEQITFNGTFLLRSRRISAPGVSVKDIPACARQRRAELGDGFIASEGGFAT